MIDIKCVKHDCLIHLYGKNNAYKIQNALLVYLFALSFSYDTMQQLYVDAIQSLKKV